jgi:hypothetical protein
MQRSILFAAVVAILGCAVAANPPCAPDVYAADIFLVMAQVGETGRLAMDFNMQAITANLTGVTSTNEFFQGTFYYSNGASHWVQGGACYPFQVPTPNFDQQCLPGNGTFHKGTVAGVPAMVYEVINSDGMNATVFTYTAEGGLPIAFQSFSWAPGNMYPVTGIIYANPTDQVDPSIFTLPAICNGAAPKASPMSFEDHPARHVLKAVLRA